MLLALFSPFVFAGPLFEGADRLVRKCWAWSPEVPGRYLCKSIILACPVLSLQALIDFENVLGLEPKNYLGDNFARVTDIYRATQYNIACCYATLGQVGLCIFVFSDFP